MKSRQLNIRFLILLFGWLIIVGLYLFNQLGACQFVDRLLELSGCQIVTEKQGAVVAYSDSGDKFHILSNGTAEIWDSHNLHRLNQISQSGILWASISPDELIFLTDNGQENLLWDLKTEQLVTPLSFEAGWADFLTDTTLILNNRGNQAMQVWTLSTEILVNEIPHLLYRAISLNKQFVAGTKENSIEVWDIESNNLIRTVDIGSYTDVRLALSGDGKWLSYALQKQNEDKGLVSEIVLVNVETGETQHLANELFDTVTVLSFNSDAVLAAGFLGGSVHFWELDNGYLLKRLNFNNRERIWSLSFSPENDNVLIGADHFTALFSLSDILD